MGKLKVVSSKEYTQRYCIDTAVNNITDLTAFRFFKNLSEEIRGKKVLEIGCLEGTSVKKIREYGADAVGIDLFCEPKYNFGIRGDFMTYPLDGPFDFIFAFGVFEKCALYSPALLTYDEYQSEMQMKNTPDKILQRLTELLNEKGVCVFSTYVLPLLFTKEMAKEHGFRLLEYSREINTEKYGEFGYNVSIVFRPNKFQVMEKI